MTSFWLFSFLRESYAELRKATWLSRSDALKSTVVVLVLVGLVAAYVALVDFVLSLLLGTVLGGR